MRVDQHFAIRSRFHRDRSRDRLKPVRLESSFGTRRSSSTKTWIGRDRPRNRSLKKSADAFGGCSPERAGNLSSQADEKKTVIALSTEHVANLG